jgi:hypothetical protein
MNQAYKYNFFQNWSNIFKNIASNINKKNDKLKKPASYPHFNSLKLQKEIFDILSTTLELTNVPNSVITDNMQKNIMAIIESIAKLLYMDDKEFVILQQFSYLANRKYDETKVLSQIREYSLSHRKHWDKLRSFLARSFVDI